MSAEMVHFEPRGLEETSSQGALRLSAQGHSLMEPRPKENSALGKDDAKEKFDYRILYLAQPGTTS
jgi:hypothetical protein